MLDSRLLATYLRQRRELGESELFLETLTALDAQRELSGSGRTARSAPDPARPVPGRPEPAEETPATADPPGSARRLRVLGEEAAGCTRCSLHEGRQNVVFGEGSVDARVVVVGEAPGANEDRTGRPFVGRAGKLLDLLLESVGLPRESVYICNVLKCRPPGNRDPRPEEVATCASYLHEQLEIIRPRALVAVGRFPAQTLLETSSSLGSLRGEVHSYRDIPLVVTYHPAFLLRSPQWTRTAWEDLQLLREIVDDDGSQEEISNGAR